MSADHYKTDADATAPTDLSRLDLTQEFVEMTKGLQVRFPIRRGVLVLSGETGTGFTAVAAWHNGAVRKNLRLRVPERSSLLKMVAEDGRLFVDESYGCFSGNDFEKRLLIDDDTASFVIQPLKYHGHLVGLIGYSSDDPTGFASFEATALAEVASRLAARMAQSVPTPPAQP